MPIFMTDKLLVSFYCPVIGNLEHGLHLYFSHIYKKSAIVL